MAADAFGGAGGVGNYMALGAESGTPTATLDLAGQESYFGLWFSAADPSNQLALLNNGTPVAILNTKGLIDFLDSNPAYFGNPNNGQDSGEPFAFVNFFGVGGTTFNQVLFANGLGSGFESDNHSIASGRVAITGTVIPGVVAPEPAAPIAFAIPCFMLAAGLVIRRSLRIA